MANNEILQFSENDIGTNLLTQLEYDSDPERLIGNQPGIARSKLVNKVLKQCSTIAAGLAKYIADRVVTDVTDDLTPTELANLIYSALGTSSTLRNNLIANGDFFNATLGTSQTTSGMDSINYWYALHFEYTKTFERVAHSVGQTDVPNNPQYFSRTNITANSATATGYCKLEFRYPDVKVLSGSEVTLSFYAKLEGVTTNDIVVSFTQFFGNLTGSPAVQFIGATKFSPGTTWSKYTVSLTLPSVSTKTIEPNDNGLWVDIWFGAGSNFTEVDLGNQTGIFDISDVKLERGNTATDFDRLDPDDFEPMFDNAYVKSIIDAGGIQTAYIYPNERISDNIVFENLLGWIFIHTDQQLILGSDNNSVDIGAGNQVSISAENSVSINSSTSSVSINSSTSNVAITADGVINLTSTDGQINVDAPVNGITLTNDTLIRATRVDAVVFDLIDWISTTVLFGKDTNGSTITDMLSFAYTKHKWRIYSTLDSNNKAFMYHAPTADGALTPEFDDVGYLGYASYRWSGVWAASSIIQTSDERLKADIKDIDELAMDAWDKVNYRQFKFKSAIEKKGDKARKHIGLIAQEVKKAFESVGLDPFEYGILCWNDIPEIKEEKDEKGNITQVARKAYDIYSIRNTEALNLEAACVRRRLSRIEKQLGLKI